MKGIKQYGKVLEGSWKSDDVSFSSRALFKTRNLIGEQDAGSIRLIYNLLRIKCKRMRIYLLLLCNLNQIIAVRYGLKKQTFCNIFIYCKVVISAGISLFAALYSFI